MTTQPIRPPGSRQALQEWSRFIDAETYLLKEYPEILFQQAANQPQSSIVRSAAESGLFAQRGVRHSNPWLQWLNRPEVSACLLTVTGHGKEIKELAVTSDSERLISIGADDTLRAWKLNGGKELFKFDNFNGKVKALMPHISWYRRAPWFITEDRGLNRIWNSENGSLIAEVKEEINELVFSPDGQIAAWVTVDVKDEWYMDLPTMPFHVGWRIESVVKVRDWHTGDRIATLYGKGRLTFSPDGRYLVYGNRVYDLRARKEMYSIAGGAHVAISADSRLLVSAQDEVSIFVYDLDKGKILFVLEGHTHWIAAVAITPDDQRIITAGKHGDIKIWDAAEHEDMETVDGFEPDQTGGFKEVKFKKAKLLHDIDGHEGTVNRLAVLDNRRVLTAAISSPSETFQSGQDFSIKVWDVENGEGLGAVAAHGDSITAFAYTPNGRRIITGDQAGIIRVWDVELLQRLKDPNTSFDSIYSISITPDCAYVVTKHIQRTAVLQTLTGREDATIDPLSLTTNSGDDPEFANGKCQVSWAQSMLEVVTKHDDVVAARFVFPEKIDLVALRGPFIAVAGSTFGKVYLLQLNGLNIEPRFAEVHRDGGRPAFTCPHCRQQVDASETELRNLITCDWCRRIVKLIDYSY